jgi:hypothetical protein
MTTKFREQFESNSRRKATLQQQQQQQQQQLRSVCTNTSQNFQ